LDPRLKSKIIIDKLFVEGTSLFHFPLKMMFTQRLVDDETVDVTQPGLQYGVSVSKRTFKRAVDRNKVKRRMREAVRLQKNIYLDKIKEPTITSMMFIYVGKEILEYKIISRAAMILMKKMPIHTSDINSKKLD
jgi:ribonuclease P protein component